MNVTTIADDINNYHQQGSFPALPGLFHVALPFSKHLADPTTLLT